MTSVLYLEIFQKYLELWNIISKYYLINSKCNVRNTYIFIEAIYNGLSYLIEMLSC